MGRDAQILCGRRPVQEFLRSGQSPASVEFVYLSESFPADFKREIESNFGRALIRVTPKRSIDALFPGVNHQGIVLVFKRGAAPAGVDIKRDAVALVSTTDGLLVALDRIQDEHNLGSIIRSAEALGAKGLIVTGKGAQPGPVSDRISAGASLHLNVATYPNLDRLIELAKEVGYWICAAASEEDSGRYNLEAEVILSTEAEELPEPEKLLLIIGHEGEGIKPIVLKKADYIVQIPLTGRTSSLNAGVAAGILIDRLLNR
jgi:23S rRNA (guanosine2251-2'-O)-methyltransferase